MSESFNVEYFANVDEHDAASLIAYLDAVTLASRDDKRRRFFAQNLSDGMRVLDAGCGTGDDVRDIAVLVGDRGSVAGVDPSAAMIAEAKRRGTPANVSFAVAPASELPFEDGAFDACRAERVLQHVADPDAATREMHRVLAPGGSLLLHDQDWETLMIAGADASVSRAIAQAFVDSLANGVAGRNARGSLRRAGFHRVELFPQIASPPLPTAYDLVLRSALDAALRRGRIDESIAKDWLLALLEADKRGEFYCGYVVMTAIGYRV